MNSSDLLGYFYWIRSVFWWVWVTMFKLWLIMVKMRSNVVIVGLPIEIGSTVKSWRKENDWIAINRGANRVKLLNLFSFHLQTEDQYIFIHDAILEAIQSGNTEVHIKNLHNHVQSLTRNLDPSSGTGTLTLMTGLKLEFRVNICFPLFFSFVKALMSFISVCLLDLDLEINCFTM